MPPKANEAAEPVAETRSPRSVSAPSALTTPTPPPADTWETLDIPHSARFSSVPHSVSDLSTHHLVKESVLAASDAIIAEEIALIKKHFTGRLESALLETLKTFSELSVEILNETRAACRATTRQMESELQRIAREASTQPGQSAETSTRKTQSKRRKKDSEH